MLSNKIIITTLALSLTMFNGIKSANARRHKNHSSRHQRASHIMQDKKIRSSVELSAAAVGAIIPTQTKKEDIDISSGGVSTITGSTQYNNLTMGGGLEVGLRYNFQYKARNAKIGVYSAIGITYTNLYTDSFDRKNATSIPTLQQGIDTTSLNMIGGDIRVGITMMEDTLKLYGIFGIGYSFIGTDAKSQVISNTVRNIVDSQNSTFISAGLGIAKDVMKDRLAIFFEAKYNYFLDDAEVNFSHINQGPGGAMIINRTHLIINNLVTVSAGIKFMI